MAKHKLKVYSRFRYGKRSFLYAGDKFRATGGPVYVGTSDTGETVKHAMGERGVFFFQRYCELGASKWIEATQGNRRAIIYVGRPRRSPRVEGLRLQPHKIRPVYVRKKAKRKGTSTLVQRELF